MIDYELKSTIRHIEMLVQNVDPTNAEDMFDNLAVIELAARNAIADHATRVLLKTNDELNDLILNNPYSLSMDISSDKRASLEM